jgi:hypothetical protein
VNNESRLDDLERLSRLWESGALTQAEFQQQKSFILTPTVPAARRRSWPIYAVVILLTAAVAAVAFANWIWASRQAVRSVPAAAVPLVVQSAKPASKAVNQTARTVPATPEPSSEDNLRFATSLEVIGLNPAYLDSRLGVPRESTSWSRIYDIGGCRLRYSVRSNRIDGFNVQITPTCQPIVQGFKVGPRTSLGSILRRMNRGEYVATCLGGCGTAAEPTIELDYEGSRAASYIGVRYIAEYSQISDAFHIWADSFRSAQGDNYTTVNVSRNPPSSIIPMLERATVNRVDVRCDYRHIC